MDEIKLIAFVNVIASTASALISDSEVAWAATSRARVAMMVTLTIIGEAVLN